MWQWIPLSLILVWAMLWHRLPFGDLFECADNRQHFNRLITAWKEQIRTRRQRSDSRGESARAKTWRGAMDLKTQAGVGLWGKAEFHPHKKRSWWKR
jgi:hypothetical protein